MTSPAARLSHLLAAIAFLACFLNAPAEAKEQRDSGVKSWITAELYGAMQWGRDKSNSTRDRLEFATAARICRDRLDKQIDDGSISRASVLLIAGTVRREGKYRGERLTLARADEIRRSIINGRIFQDLVD